MSHLAPEWLSMAREKVESLRYGLVQIVVHGSSVIQIERNEKTRIGLGKVVVGEELATARLQLNESIEFVSANPRGLRGGLRILDDLIPLLTTNKGNYETT